MKKRYYILLFFWLFMLAYLVMTLIITRDVDTPVSELVVDIRDKDEASFVSEKDIERIVLKNIPKLKRTNIWEIDAQELENKIRKHPSLLTADVYKTEGGFLRVEVRQKRPLLRLIANGRNAYIDVNGTLMYFSNAYTAHVPVAIGHFNLPKDFTDKENYPKLINDLYYLTEYLNDEPFLKAQFEQIYIDKKKEIVLIPRVGNHRIRIASVDDLDMKFKKLYALYDQEFKEYGWKKYKEINLKYKGQVVCVL